MTPFARRVLHAARVVRLSFVSFGIRSPIARPRKAMPTKPCVARPSCCRHVLARERSGRQYLPARRGLALWRRKPARNARGRARRTRCLIKRTRSSLSVAWVVADGSAVARAAVLAAGLRFPQVSAEGNIDQGWAGIAPSR